MSTERNIRWDLIARLCPNATGAELRSVCTEAGMFAIRERRKVVSEKDCLAAVEKVRALGSALPPHPVTLRPISLFLLTIVLCLAGHPLGAKVQLDVSSLSSISTALVTFFHRGDTTEYSLLTALCVANSQWSLSAVPVARERIRDPCNLYTPFAFVSLSASSTSRGP